MIVAFKNKIAPEYYAFNMIFEPKTENCYTDSKQKGTP